MLTVYKIVKILAINFLKAPMCWKEIPLKYEKFQKFEVISLKGYEKTHKKFQKLLKSNQSCSRKLKYEIKLSHALTIFQKYNSIEIQK